MSFKPGKVKVANILFHHVHGFLGHAKKLTIKDLKNMPKLFQRDFIFMLKSPILSVKTWSTYQAKIA